MDWQGECSGRVRALACLFAASKTSCGALANRLDPRGSPCLTPSKALREQGDIQPVPRAKDSGASARRANRNGIALGKILAHSFITVERFSALKVFLRSRVNGPLHVSVNYGLVGRTSNSRPPARAISTCDGAIVLHIRCLRHLRIHFPVIFLVSSGLLSVVDPRRATGGWVF